MSTYRFKYTYFLPHCASAQACSTGRPRFDKSSLSKSSYNFFDREALLNHTNDPFREGLIIGWGYMKYSLILS